MLLFILAATTVGLNLGRGRVPTVHIIKICWRGCLVDIVVIALQEDAFDLVFVLGFAERCQLLSKVLNADLHFIWMLAFLLHSLIVELVHHFGLLAQVGARSLSKILIVAFYMLLRLKRCINIAYGRFMCSTHPAIFVSGSLRCCPLY